MEGRAEPTNPMTLQDIADDLEHRIENSTSGSKTEILEIVAELVDVLMENAGPSPKNATIAKLQAEVASLNSLLNNDAATFEAIKLALGNANLTQGQLAQEISTNWRHI